MMLLLRMSRVAAEIQAKGWQPTQRANSAMIGALWRFEDWAGILQVKYVHDIYEHVSCYLWRPRYDSHLYLCQPRYTYCFCFFYPADAVFCLSASLYFLFFVFIRPMLELCACLFFFSTGLWERKKKKGHEEYAGERADH